jgi:hypothetical protein
MDPLATEALQANQWIVINRCRYNANKNSLFQGCFTDNPAINSIDKITTGEKNPHFCIKNR